MEGTGRTQPLYFPMGMGFYHFICRELNSGTEYRKNRAIVLLHMISRANTIPGQEFFAEGQRLRFGECLISRSGLQRDCNITENQARAAVNWLVKNGHIMQEGHEGTPASVGTFYTVMGLKYREIYQEYENPTKGKDAKNTDNTEKNGGGKKGKPPSTQQKPPSADGEKSPCLSAFFDAGGTENNRNNIIGFPVGNSNISVNNSYTGPKTQNRDNFEQFKTPQLLENYILSVTNRSRERNKYICPFCGSGTKKNGTGALSIDKRRGGTTWTCFSCGLHGDIFDFAGYLNGTTDKNEQLQIVAQFVNGKPLYYGKEEAPRQGIGL